MSTHIGTLNEWYESAERITKTNLPNDGDAIIYPRFGGGGYVIETDTKDWEAAYVQNDEDCRIFHRAPAPKPAWHNAVAVMAVTPASPSRGVLVGAGEGEWYSYRWNRYVKSDDLRDVTPLIEAKVTDEMVKRAEDWYAHSSVLNDPVEDVLGILTAALGLETA